MTLTLKQELEKIVRKMYPQLSLHGVSDYRTQLEPLDRIGFPSKKQQVEIILMLCQRVEDLEKEILVLQETYVRTTTTKQDTKKTL